jgi:hypothetical protein
MPSNWVQLLFSSCSHAIKHRKKKTARKEKNHSYRFLYHLLLIEEEGQRGDGSLLGVLGPTCHHPNAVCVWSLHYLHLPLVIAVQCNTCEEEVTHGEWQWCERKRSGDGKGIPV